MDDAQAFLNVLGGKITNLFCARSDGNAISRHTSSSACCNGRRRQPLELRNDLLPPAADQVHTIRLQSRDSGQAHAASDSVSVSARYHESNTTVWKSTPNRRAFLISHSANWCFEIPLGVFRRNPTGKCPRRHPMRGEHDMAFHIPFRLRIPHGRHMVSTAVVSLSCSRIVSSITRKPRLGWRSPRARGPGTQAAASPGRATRGASPRKPRFALSVPVPREQIIDGLHGEAGRDYQSDHITRQSVGTDPIGPQAQNRATCASPVFTDWCLIPHRHEALKSPMESGAGDEIRTLVTCALRVRFRKIPTGQRRRHSESSMERAPARYARSPRRARD